MQKMVILICFFGLPLCLSSQLLWEIKGNGAKQKSYLLATNKYLAQDFLDSIPNIFKCFEQCQCVVTEFEMQDYETLSTLRTAAMLSDSTSLKTLFTPNEYATIQQQVALFLGIDLDKLNRLKPSYLTALYREEVIKQTLNYDENRTLDKFFSLVAAAKQMPVYGLDTKEETLYMLFEREPLHHQCTELKQVVRNPLYESELEQNVLQLYKQGRLNDIAYLVQSPDNGSTLSFSDYQIFVKRNKEWLKRLAVRLRSERCFITLNAVYLGGEKGLLQQLRAKGYTVQPVNRKIR